MVSISRIINLIGAEAWQAKDCVEAIAGLLRRISLDLTRDHLRRSARIRQVELSDDIPCPQPSAQQSLEQRQLIEIVAGVLKAMPRQRRAVFSRGFGTSSMLK
jgi:DNA-directed RNA polymerase specialized sigma24 family protein